MVWLDTHLESIKAALPVKVRKVLWAPPRLYMEGRDWSLAAYSLWRFIDVDGLFISNLSAQPKERCERLTGRQVIRMSFQGGCLVDLSLVFDDGSALEIFSESDRHSWTLCLPNLTLVGPAIRRSP